MRKSQTKVVKEKKKKVQVNLDISRKSSKPKALTKVWESEIKALKGRNFKSLEEATEELVSLVINKIKLDNESIAIKLKESLLGNDVFVEKIQDVLGLARK